MTVAVSLMIVLHNLRARLIVAVQGWPIWQNSLGVCPMIKLLPVLAETQRPRAAVAVSSHVSAVFACDRKRQGYVRPCLLPETLQASPETMQTLAVRAVYLRHWWRLAAARAGLMEVDGQSRWRRWVIYNSPTQVAWDSTVAATSCACPACAGRLWLHTASPLLSSLHGHEKRGIIFIMRG